MTLKLDPMSIPSMLLPPFSLKADALGASFNYQNLENIKFSMQISEHARDVKCLSFYSRNKQLLCFYYELDKQRNRIEILKCSDATRNASILFSKEVERGFLDPIIMEYCPELNIFCCLEATTVGCHRLGHCIVFYSIRGQGLKRLACLSPYFSELFENFELLPKYKACVTTSRNMISLWSICSKKRLSSLETSETISCLKYVPKADMVLCGGRRRIFAYQINVKSGFTMLYQLRGHYDSIVQLCWNQANKTLFSIDYEGKILLWALSREEGTLMKEIECKNSSEGLFFFSSSSTLVTTDSHNISIFDSEKGILKNSMKDMGKLIGYDTVNQCMIFWKGSEITFQNDRIMNTHSEPPFG